MDMDTTQSLSERWSSRNFQEMVHLWNLTAEDQVNLRQLQKRIQDMDHWKNDPFEVVRYYKTYKSLSKTETMVRRMVAWRIDQDMDTFLQRHGTPDPLWLQLPCAILNTCDKEGDPILLDRVGAADSLGLYKALGGEAFADYAVFCRELMCSPAFWKHYQDNNQGGRRRVRYFNLIVDLEDLHGGPLKPGLIRVLQKVARILQDCYAGWEKRIFIIRAPTVFKYAWSIVQYFFDQEKRDSIIFGTKSDYLDVLQKYFDLENLPPIIAPLQGKAQGYPGHFAKVELQGGPLRRYNNSNNSNNNNNNNKQPSSSMNHSEITASLSSELSESCTTSDTRTTNVNVCSKVMAKGTFHPPDPKGLVAISYTRMTTN